MKYKFTETIYKESEIEADTLSDALKVLKEHGTKFGSLSASGNGTKLTSTGTTAVDMLVSGLDCTTIIPVSEWERK